MKAATTWSRTLALPLAAWVLIPHLMAAELKPKTLLAWREYVRLTEKRLERERLESGTGTGPAPEVASGGVVVSAMETLDGTGREFPVPGGLIHHWQGVILIPEVTVEGVLGVVRNPVGLERYYEDVLESRLLEQHGDVEVIHLKLRRSQAVVQVAYDTEHRVEYHWRDERSVSSRSVATKIAEIVELGKVTEHERPEGNDRGYLWKLNAYWGYREVEEGVLVRCEALILSRSIPFLVRFLLRPLVDGIARSWMERTLKSLRKQVLAELKPARAP